MTDTRLTLAATRSTAFILPQMEDALPTPGTIQGVVITLPADLLEETVAQCSRWFEERDDVLLVDSGLSAKAEHGYLILEWEESEIDPLFLALLRDDEDIHDYLCYERETEEGAS